MKKLLQLSLVFIALFAINTLNAQTTITEWNFEADPLTPNVDNPAASTGIGSASIVGSMGTLSRGAGSQTGCVQLAGTGSWAIGNASPGSNESSGAQFLVSTTGFNSISVSWDHRMSNAAARTERFQYTLDGTTWVNFVADATNSTITCNGSYDNGKFDRGNTIGDNMSDSWSRKTVNLSSISGANDNQNFGFRVVAAHYDNTGEFRRANTVGTEATGGTWRFDNVKVEGTSIVPQANISVNTTTLPTLLKVLPSVSSQESFTVEGSSLTADITITASTGFEISTSSASGFGQNVSLTPSSGVVASTEIFVRISQATIGNISGNVTISSTNSPNVTVAVSGIVSTPTNPTAFDLSIANYSFTAWDSLATLGSYPSNVRFWTTNELEADLDVIFADDWSCLYNLPNRSRILGEGANGISFVNTGNAQYEGTCDGSNPGGGNDLFNARPGAFVLTLNTTNRQNVSVSWVGRTKFINGREYALRMQYRTTDGNNDPNSGWLNFATPVEYNRQTNDGDSLLINTNLPSACNDLPFVQLRWVYYFTGNGSGSRAHLGLDNIVVTSDAIGTSSIVLNPSTLTAFNQILGNPSNEKIVSVEGLNLTENIEITAPADYEISTISGSGFSSTVTLTQTGGSVSATNIYVRLNATTLGTKTGVLLFESEGNAGAISQTINLTGTVTSPVVLPELYINEFMASNSSTIADEYGEFDDWIEIYNASDDEVDLAGYYISDDLLNITKYRIPTNSTEATIPAKGFLLIWADNQSPQGDLHTNFGLSANGEDVVLTAPDGTTIIDSYTYGPQTSDVSMGREEDGFDEWVFFTTPTPRASNSDSGVSISNLYGENTLVVYPVPSNGASILHFNKTIDFSLFDLTGKVCLKGTNQNQIDISNLAKGLYILNSLIGEKIKIMID